MRKTANNPGSADLSLVVGGNSTDFHAHGGHSHPAPLVMNKRIQVRSTDHPRGDRWVSLTTVHEGLDFTYRVAIVDGFNSPAKPPREYADLNQARRAARRLLRRMENN